MGGVNGKTEKATFLFPKEPPLPSHYPEKTAYLYPRWTNRRERLLQAFDNSLWSTSDRKICRVAGAIPPATRPWPPYIVFTMVQSCAIVMLSAPVVPAAEPGVVDPVVVLAVVSPDGVLPAVEPLASPDVLPLPAADAVCMVLQSCFIRSCCSAVSFDQFALSSS